MQPAWAGRGQRRRVGLGSGKSVTRKPWETLASGKVCSLGSSFEVQGSATWQSLRGRGEITARVSPRSLKSHWSTWGSWKAAMGWTSVEGGMGRLGEGDALRWPPRGTRTARWGGQRGALEDSLSTKQGARGRGDTHLTAPSAVLDGRRWCHPGSRLRVQGRQDLLRPGLAGAASRSEARRMQGSSRLAKLERKSARADLQTCEDGSEHSPLEEEGAGQKRWAGRQDAAHITRGNQGHWQRCPSCSPRTWVRIRLVSWRGGRAPRRKTPMLRARGGHPLYALSFPRWRGIPQPSGTVGRTSRADRYSWRPAGSLGRGYRSVRVGAPGPSDKLMSSLPWVHGVCRLSRSSFQSPNTCERREAWRAAVHRVTKSRTQLGDWATITYLGKTRWADGTSHTRGLWPVGSEMSSKERQRETASETEPCPHPAKIGNARPSLSPGVMARIGATLRS